MNVLDKARRVENYIYRDLCSDVVLAARAPPGRGIDHGARGSGSPAAPPPTCRWALRMASTPGNALALGGRRASIAGRPDRWQSLLVQDEEGCGAEKTVRYLRAKDLQGCEAGEPLRVGEARPLFFLIRGRTCSFGRGVGLGRLRTGSCGHLRPIGAISGDPPPGSLTPLMSGWTRGVDTGFGCESPCYCCCFLFGGVLPPRPPWAVACRNCSPPCGLQGGLRVGDEL